MNPIAATAAALLASSEGAYVLYSNTQTTWIVIPDSADADADLASADAAVIAHLADTWYAPA
jgi:hypothetical protein